MNILEDVGLYFLLYIYFNTYIHVVIYN